MGNSCPKPLFSKVIQEAKSSQLALWLTGSIIVFFSIVSLALHLFVFLSPRKMLTWLWHVNTYCSQHFPQIWQHWQDPVMAAATSRAARSTACCCWNRRQRYGHCTPCSVQTRHRSDTHAQLTHTNTFRMTAHGGRKEITDARRRDWLLHFPAVLLRTYQIHHDLLGSAI